MGTPLSGIKLPKEPIKICLGIFLIPSIRHIVMIALSCRRADDVTENNHGGNH